MISRSCIFQNGYINNLKTLYPEQFKAVGGRQNRDTDEKVFRQNFLKAAVFFEDLNYEIVSEVPVYSVRCP